MCTFGAPMALERQAALAPLATSKLSPHTVLGAHEVLRRGKVGLTPLAVWAAAFLAYKTYTTRDEAASSEDCYETLPGFVFHVVPRTLRLRVNALKAKELEVCGKQPTWGCLPPQTRMSCVETLLVDVPKEEGRQLAVVVVDAEENTFVHSGEANYSVPNKDIQVPSDDLLGGPWQREVQVAAKHSVLVPELDDETDDVYARAVWLAAVHRAGSRAGLHFAAPFWVRWITQGYDVFRLNDYAMAIATATKPGRSGTMLYANTKRAGEGNKKRKRGEDGTTSVTAV